MKNISSSLLPAMSGYAPEKGDVVSMVVKDIGLVIGELVHFNDDIVILGLLPDEESKDKNALDSMQKAVASEIGYSPTRSTYKADSIISLTQYINKRKDAKEKT